MPPKQDYPLHVAVKNNDLETVAEWLDKKYPVNTPNTQGMRALHIAAFKNSLPILNALIQAGADPNVVDDDQETPLHMAATNGSLDCVAALLGYGANPDLLTKDGHSALALSKTSHCSFVLLAGSSQETIDNAAAKAMNAGLETGDLKRLEFLLNPSEGIPETKKASAQKLMDQLINITADPQNKNAISGLLFKHGATLPKKKTKTPKEKLNEACEAGDLKTADSLVLAIPSPVDEAALLEALEIAIKAQHKIEKEADKQNHKNIITTILFYLAQKTKKTLPQKMLHLLAEYGLLGALWEAHKNINHTHKENGTSLLYKVCSTPQHNKESIKQALVAFLIKNNPAAVNEINPETKKSPLDGCVELNDSDSVRLLLEANIRFEIIEQAIANIGDPHSLSLLQTLRKGLLVSAAKNDFNKPQIERALALGADLNFQGGSHQTLLMRLAATKETKTKRELLAWLLMQPTINLELKDIDGLTALHVATLFEQTNYIAALVKTGADMHSLNAKKRSPYIDAQHLPNIKAVFEKHLKDHDDIISKTKALAVKASLSGEGTPERKTARDTLNTALENAALTRENKEHLLFFAVEFDDPEMVETLLRQDADDEIKAELFVLAIEKESDLATEMLTRHKPDEVLKNSHGDTMLHLAARFGSEGAVACLLNKEQVDPDVVNINNETALHLSINPATTELLLSKSNDETLRAVAEISFKPNNYWKLEHGLRSDTSERFLKIVLNVLDKLDMTASQKETLQKTISENNQAYRTKALCKACEAGELEAVQNLLRENLFSKEELSAGFRATYHAPALLNDKSKLPKQNYEEILLALLEARPDLEYADDAPHFIAAHKFVRVLEKIYPKIDAKHRHSGTSVLHKLSLAPPSITKLGLMAILLARNPEGINEVHPDTKASLLHHCIEAKDEAGCRLLIDNRIKKNHRNFLGETPLEATERLGLNEITDLLQPSSKKSSAPAIRKKPPEEEARREAIRAELVKEEDEQKKAKREAKQKAAEAAKKERQLKEKKERLKIERRLKDEAVKEEERGKKDAEKQRAQKLKQEQQRKEKEACTLAIEQERERILAEYKRAAEEKRKLAAHNRRPPTDFFLPPKTIFATSEKALAEVPDDEKIETIIDAALDKQDNDVIRKVAGVKHNSTGGWHLIERAIDTLRWSDNGDDVIGRLRSVLREMKAYPDEKTAVIVKRMG